MMTSAIVDNILFILYNVCMKTQAELGDSAKNWLQEGHGYLFAKSLKTHADPTSRATYLISEEIANKWHRFQLFADQNQFGDQDLSLRSTQQILKACGAARAALVWSYVQAGAELDDGSNQSWQDLDEYQSKLADGTEELPKQALLSEPIEVALAPYELRLPSAKPVFTRMAGLAIAYLDMQQAQFGEALIPRPGIPSGYVEEWTQT